MNIHPSIYLFLVLWYNHLNGLYADVDTDSSSAKNISSSSSSSSINDALEGQQQEQYENLETMTNEELEEICISRGFEVVKETDEETGETKAYSHEDYVHAAKQCLEIEAEMEEILSKHPELVQEIEAEAERMRQENEKLQSKIKDLIHDNIEVDHDHDYEQHDQNATNSKVSPSSTLIVRDDSDEIIDLDHNITYQNNNLEQETNQSPVNDNSRDAISPVSAPPNEILTFGDITREVKAQMLRDLQRVVNILRPACKPVIKIVRDATKTVYGMVKRYALNILQGSSQSQRSNEEGGDDKPSSAKTSQDDIGSKVKSKSS